LEIIVVDNASADGSASMVETDFNWVKLVKLSENKGLAFGNNAGLEASSGEYLLYLGSDAFPERDTISGMVDYFDSHPDVGIATCKLVLRDGTLDKDAHRGIPTPWVALTHLSKLSKLFPKSRIFNQYFMDYEDFTVPHEIGMCISHFMMIRRDVLLKANKWDTAYFLFGEDVDMCYQVKSLGFKVMYLPQWKALHYKGATIGLRKTSQDVAKASRETKVRSAKNRADAMTLFYRKNMMNKYPKLVTYGTLAGIALFNKVRNLFI
jgi:hypothetical protein